MMMTERANLDANHDLKAVFDAMMRGTRRSRLRTASVVCSADHLLLEVYRGESGELWGLGVTELPGSNKSRGSKLWNAYRLDDDLRGAPEGSIAANMSLSCRCADGWAWGNLPVTPIRDAIE